MYIALVSRDRFASSVPERGRANAEALRVEDLLEDATRGHFALPAFQRQLRWDREDKELLFDSIYRGFPIGTLIFWKRERWENAKPLVQESEGKPTRFVVDGQQRLMTLFRVLKTADDEPKHELMFDLESQQFKYLPKIIESLKTSTSAAEARTPKKAVPLSVVLDPVVLQEWVVERPLSKDEQRLVFALGSAIREYRVSTYTIEGDHEQTARDVFARVNSSGKSLKKEEVFRGLFGASEFDLDALALTLNEDEFGRYKERTLLRSVFAIVGIPLEEDVATVSRTRSKELKDGVRRALGSLTNTRAFLRDDARCAHLSLVPYELCTLVLARFFDLFRNPHPRSLTLLRRWFWRGVAGGRLEGNTSNAREHVQAVRDNEHSTVQRLLALSGQRDEVQFDDYTVEIQLNRAASRTRVALLALRKPQHLITDEVFSLPSMVRDGPFPLLNSGWAQGGVRTLGALFIHPRLSAPELERSLLHASRESLVSHCVTDAALLRLREGDFEGFVAQRSRDLGSWLATSWRALAEPSHDDAPPMEYFVDGPLAEAGE